jgi:hypothetical protein
MLFISPAYERHLGQYPPHATSPWSFLDAVHPDDLERVRHAYQRRLTRLTVEYRITRPAGDVVWIEYLQCPIRRQHLLAGLAFDITRTQLETQLVESEDGNLGRLAARRGA